MGAAPRPTRHLRGKFAVQKRRNPRLLGGTQARPLKSPKVCGRTREGAAQPPNPLGGAASVVAASGSPKPPPAWHRWVSLRSSAPLSLSFWAVDNPHTRKSCLLGPADCSSPPPPPPLSPLPPLPPPSLAPGAPGQLARGQACHRRCWCSCCRRCCSRGPEQAALTPHLLGPSPALPRREGPWRAERKGEELAGRPGIPLLVDTCCHWPTDTQKSGKEVNQDSTGCLPPHKRPVNCYGAAAAVIVISSLVFTVTV